MAKTVLILTAVVVVAAGVAAALRVSRATSNAHPTPPPKSNFSVDQARAFSDFPVYSAGPSVDGIPLVAVLRRDNGPNYVSFIYGDCTPADDQGCAPPAEVQVWPACTRNISIYDPQFGPPFTRTEIRGAPAFAFEDAHRLEIQTGISTVVVFGATPDLVTRIAARLRGLNVPVQPGEPLPPPAAGALEGKLGCT